MDGFYKNRIDSWKNQLNEDEIREVVKTIIAQFGASSMADMGKVMGSANQQLAGKADGKIIAQIVKSLLS